MKYGSEQKIIDIAFEVGFESLRTFNKVFSSMGHDNTDTVIGSGRVSEKAHQMNGALFFEMKNDVPEILNPQSTLLCKKPIDYLITCYATIFLANSMAFC